MAIHRIYRPLAQRPDALLPGTHIQIEGSEAHHAARVKRLGVGSPLEIITGTGSAVQGTIARIDKPSRGEWTLTIQITQTVSADPIEPQVHVYAAAPKGRHLEEMVDQLSQVGAASWTPLLSERTVVEPRAHKLDRLVRVTIEAAKQCGRAHLLSIGSPVRLEDVLAQSAQKNLLIADATGGRCPKGCPSPCTLLIGPEGGWTAAELDLAQRAGAEVVCFGVHTMRIETAAVAACSILLGNSV